MDDNETNSGRVKGSIKDRLISFLFRKRFRMKFEKNNIIKKATNINLIKKNNIRTLSYRDLNKLKDKVIPVDVKKEKFDFEKYDYYIIEPVMKKGIDNNYQNKSIINNSKSIIDFLRLDLNSIKQVESKIEQSKKELIKRKEKIEKEINNNEFYNIDKYKINNIRINNNIDEINKELSIYESEIYNLKKEFNLRKKQVYDKANYLKDILIKLGIENNIDYLDNINIISISDIDDAQVKLNEIEKDIKDYENNLNVIKSINTTEFINPIGIESEKEDVEIVEKKEDIKENKELESNKKEINKDKTLFSANEKKIKEKKQEINQSYNKKVIKKIEKENIEINSSIKDSIKEDKKEIIKIPKEIIKVNDKNNNVLDDNNNNNLLNKNSMSNDLVNAYILNQEILSLKDFIYNKIIKNEKDDDITEILINDTLKKLSLIKKDKTLSINNYNQVKELENILLSKQKEFDIIYKEDVSKVKIKENKKVDINNSK